MLVSLNEILPKAYRNGYAVGAFNVYNLETAKAVVDAAVEEKSPVILGISEKAIAYAGVENLSAIITDMAERAPIPVVLHLDHGRDFKIIQKCVENNFTSIMIDASHFPENQKILVVKKVVKLCEKHNVSVESERDSLGGQEDDVIGRSDKFTKPDTAAVFVRETGIDVFAPSIGNAHGIPLPDEKLDIELLSEVNKKLKMPLVLHGASSTPESVIRQCIANGVTKINIDTDLRQAFFKSIRAALDEDKKSKDPRDALSKTMEAMRAVVKEKIEHFGSARRA